MSYVKFVVGESLGRVVIMFGDMVKYVICYSEVVVGFVCISYIDCS